MYVAELRGMTQKLQMTVGEIYAPDCSADLSDTRCGVDLATLEESGTVNTVISATAFETTLAQATGWYDGGELTWTSGANAGQTVAVRSWDAGTSTLCLFLPAPYAIQMGDPSRSAPAATRPSPPARQSSPTPSTSVASHTPRATTRCSGYPDAQS